MNKNMTSKKRGEKGRGKNMSPSEAELQEFLKAGQADQTADANTAGDNAVGDDDKSTFEKVVDSVVVEVGLKNPADANAEAKAAADTIFDENARVNIDAESGFTAQEEADAIRKQAFADLALQMEMEQAAEDDLKNEAPASDPAEATNGGATAAPAGILKLERPVRATDIDVGYTRTDPKDVHKDVMRTFNKAMRSGPPVWLGATAPDPVRPQPEARREAPEVEAEARPAASRNWWDRRFGENASGN